MAKTSNQGAERVARRTRQTANKGQADKDAQLTPPSKKEKVALAGAALAKTVAKFGDGTKGGPRKVAQAANKQRSETEAVRLAAPSVDEAAILAGVLPGQTPSLRQLRLLSKQAQRPIDDEAHEIARQAGRLVKDVLIGRRRGAPSIVRRHQTMEQAQRQLHTANTTE